MKVTEATNFLRVFRLPDVFPSDYCFGGGHPSTFILVDWFNAFSPQDFWGNEIKEFDKVGEEYLSHIEKLRDFIKGKKYFNSAHTYMVLTDYGDVFLVNPEEKTNKLQEQYDAIRQDAEQAMKREFGRQSGGPEK